MGGGDQKAQVLAYGSSTYRGAYGPADDVDTLVLVSNCCYRSGKHFGTFIDALVEEFARASPQHFQVKLRLERGDFPLLKVDFRCETEEGKVLSFPLDLCINVVVDADCDPSSVNIYGPDALKQVDPRFYKGIDGPRTSQLLLQTFPDDKMHLFLTARRAIKAWAKALGIYCKRLGFFSGIMLSIMVARIVQELSAASTVEEIIIRFFNVYADFDWRHDQIELRQLAPKACQDKMYPHQALDYDRARSRHVMVVLTPAVPTTNTALRVRKDSLDTLLARLRSTRYYIQKEGFDFRSTYYMNGLFQKVDASRSAYFLDVEMERMFRESTHLRLVLRARAPPDQEGDDHKRQRTGTVRTPFSRTDEITRLTDYEFFEMWAEEAVEFPRLLRGETLDGNRSQQLPRVAAHARLSLDNDPTPKPMADGLLCLDINVDVILDGIEHEGVIELLADLAANREGFDEWAETWLGQGIFSTFARPFQDYSITVAFPDSGGFDSLAPEPMELHVYRAESKVLIARFNCNGDLIDERAP